MGYTTKFKGELLIMPAPSLDIISETNAFSKERHDCNTCPGIWCQWVINADGKLCWNGAEKFYNYIEWLEYLIEHFFMPKGYVLQGRIAYRGERFEDIGMICVKDNNVRNLYGAYDVSENEILLLTTMDESGRVEIEVLP